jgi:quercetin dioxygenase-like cupin family protein
LTAVRLERDKPFTRRAHRRMMSPPPCRANRVRIGASTRFVEGSPVNHDGRMAMADERVSEQLQSFDSNTMPWGELYIDQLKVGVPQKAFISDPDTGMSVQMIRYEAGFTNPWHRHNCAHGIYVLDGTLKTHAGTFGPGSFVWFPEGMMMEHGATDERDVVTLFITNKPFDIHYAFEDEGQGGQT